MPTLETAALLPAFLAVCAAGPAFPQSRDAGGRLAAGLDAIRPERIRADVEFFADDDMRGRDTPSHELRVAARFVRARLERLGFTPGAGDGFFHTYDLVTKRIDENLSRVVVTADGIRRELRFAEDYFVYSTKHFVDISFSGGVVFCGEGDRKELKDVELDGRWALCFAGDVSATRVMRNVARVGGAGLIVIPDPRKDDEPFVERLRQTTRFALEGVTSPARPSSRSDDPPPPAIFLTRAAGLGLLEASRALGDLESGLPELGAELGIGVAEVRRGGGGVPVENVCGLWPGDDPALSDEIIIVSAHYDHVGARGDVVWNGADDNASGSMGLLALAEALAAHGPLRRSVLLMWVSGEEKGLWGSDAWTRAPVLPEGGGPICDINIDMIGRNAPDYILITPSPEHRAYNGLSKLLHRFAELEGFTDVGSADPWWARSDHANFERHLDIPVAFLFSDEHEDYHQPTDTPEKLDYDKLHRVVRLVFRTIAEMQKDDLDLISR